MSQDVRTRSAESGDRESLDGLDDLGGGPSVSATDVLDRLWRFFISMRTGLVLILGLGLLSLIGTLLAQAPAGLAADPAAYTSWVASIHSKYGGWTPVFDKLGFFAIFTSIWFKAITVLLTTSVLACSVNRAPRLWKLAFHPRTRMGETFFTHAPLRASVLVPAEPGETMDYVREVLQSHRFRTINDPDDDGLNLYADRFRWGPFGTVVAHAELRGHPRRVLPQRDHRLQEHRAHRSRGLDGPGRKRDRAVGQGNVVQRRLLPGRLPQ